MAEERLPRDRELAGRTDSALYGELIETYDQVRRGFDDQADRADQIADYWEAYNCILGRQQFYNGNSEIYVPIIRNAVNARRTRFINQVFPASGRYIDATSSDGSVPRAIVALLEHYVRSTKLRTAIMPALLRNGDIEGQYNLYVTWDETSRWVGSRETKPPVIDMDGVDVEAPDGEEIETFDEQEVISEGPSIEVLHDSDICVLPASSSSIEEACDLGSVTILRRWNKGKIKKMAADGDIIKGRADALIEAMEGQGGKWNADKKIQEAAGIRGGAGGKVAHVYETWKKIMVKGRRRLVRIYFGGDDLVLGAKVNPWWNDRCPLISCPVEKVAGSFKGQSLIAPVWTTQLHANDIANQGADSTTYSMLPIVMTDPAANPRTATMILNLAAVWECNPASTRFAEFPKLWQDAIGIIQADTQLIFQTLGVNPAMLPQQTGRTGQKRNQAEIALEQSVDLLTTAEACSVLEEGILTPLVGERFVELDHQFRDDALTVRSFGELGIAAKMESVAPIQVSTRYEFTWFGVEQARSMQAQQQQVALLNVMRGMQQPLQAAGYMIDPAPALEIACQNVFGARLGRLVLKDMRDQLGVDPQIENQMLQDGFEVHVHALDDDAKHIQAHMAAKGDDPSGMFRIHIMKHQQQMATKAAAMQQRQMGAPGVPGGAGPGVAGTPQPGAQPAGPRLIKGPPGMMGPEALARGPGVPMPRKM